MTGHEHVWWSALLSSVRRCLQCGATEPKGDVKDTTYGDRTGRPAPTTPNGTTEVTGL